jgi:hypothetical protein
MDLAIISTLGQLAYVPVNVVMAIVALSSTRRVAANWALAASFLVWALHDALNGASAFVHDRSWSFTLVVFAAVIFPAVPLSYAVFVGHALPTKPARWLRSPVAFAAYGGLFLASAALTLAAPRSVLACGSPTATGGWSWCSSDSLLGVSLSVGGELLGLLAFSYTFACGIHYYGTSARGTMARERAGLYLGAFGLYDMTLIAVFLSLFGGPKINAWTFLLAAPVNLGANVAIAVALLRYQLFDFDLKVKVTLKRGALIGVFLAAFLVGVAIAEQYLQQFGWIAGGVTVGLLLFALRPIERAIDRLADRAMPRTTGTAEYLAQRKHEIYRAALEDAMRDGAVSARERALLLRLAENLGLDGNDANRIEREILAAIPGGA